ncbi:MAG: hypothetical protein IH948_10745 [Bacteroidetes bacterium]|nr:hypothetical protein [Bacteroidota bacterium]
MTLHIQAADVSAIGFLGPILAFLVVVIIVFALLRKSKLLGGNAWIDSFVSLFVGGIFVALAGATDVILSVTPWFAVLLMALFFIMILVGLIGKTDIVGKGLGWVFIIVLLVIFVAATVNVYSGDVGHYLPGPFYGAGGDPQVLFFLDWLYSAPVVGAIVLLIAAAIVGTVLIKFG